ncbi:hypothetical protein S-CBS2_gp027 [Synechococcus phage S-CBS2]|uniref:hypothetical protein n=1 Tax=Synechococcus phage S-CBS2 TaxID=753084 RepID=UPI00020783F4|nr:hypothetical protein S-CBS2_gp027 [Synechococcus phage S-CBS2]ADF42383.1 hypothetical protein S-CBS2_gp027 [Synechococcus phage S-CBS2]
MAISPSHFSAASVKDNKDVVIEMLASRPTVDGIFSPARTPGLLCGYYNATGDYVELYMVAASGIRFLRIG